MCEDANNLVMHFIGRRSRNVNSYDSWSKQFAMELGLDFDDCDLVSIPKEKSILKSYNAKVCYNKWFLSVKAETGTNDRATIYKFRGDYYYHTKDYLSAIQNYLISLEAINSQNRTMRRELTDSLTRCYIMSDQFTLAEECLHKTFADCLTPDQVCQGLMLQQQLLQCQGHIRGEIAVIQKLVELHPMNSNFWMMLVRAYSLIIAESKRDSIGNHRSKCCYHGDRDSSSVQAGVLSNSCHDNSAISNIYDMVSEIGMKDGTNICNVEVRGDNHKVLLDSDANLESKSERKMQIVTKGDGSDTQCVCSRKDLTSSDLGVKGHLLQEIFTGYPGHLVQLTCYIRAKLILKCVTNTVASLVKDRTLHQLTQVEDDIQRLGVDEMTMNTVTEFMEKDMFEDEYFNQDGPDDSKQETVTEQKTSEEMTTEDFNTKWFSWINDI